MARKNVQTSAPRRSHPLPEGYVEDPAAGAMLRFQASLPRLPVPPLASTVSKYLETVKPHLSDAEYATTVASAHAFLASPLAADLQRRLEARAADPGMKNWLADWWNEAAYMGYRDPVAVFVSYFYVHVDDPRRRDAAGRAASLIKAMLPFRALTESCVVFVLCRCACASMVMGCVLGNSSSRNRSAGCRCAWRRTSGCQCRVWCGVGGSLTQGWC